MHVVPLHNEQNLLDQIAAGNEHAFETIYNHYRPVIFTKALRLTDEDWTAEEIVQDTFLQVWLKRSELRRLDNFSGWLYTIAVNLTYNSLVKKARERKRKIEGAFSSTDEPQTPQELLQYKEYEKILEEAVNALPEKQKQTYNLIKKQGKKRDEAALELDVSPETVKWNLDQATRRIRAYYITRIGGAGFMFLYAIIFLKKFFL